MTSKEESLTRATKLQKLNHLRRSVPDCSKSSLESILQHVSEYGVPELTNRKQMTEAATRHLAQFSAYGPLLVDLPFTKRDGKVIELTMVNFQSLLDAACRVGGSFYQCLSAAMATNPCTPSNNWNILLYSDECLPANALGRAAKKVWTVYASIKELGRPALSHTQHWLPLCILRTSIASSLDGHMGQVMKVIMEQIFLSTSASPLVGVVVHGPDDKPLRLYYKLGFIVQDGASQKITFGLKGDSGSNYCIKCSNQISFLPPDESGTGANTEHAVLRSISKKQLVLSSDEEAIASWDRLAARKLHCSPHEFELWEQATGWTFSAHGILSSIPLRPWLKPVTQFHHDFMHGMASNGCMNTMMFCVLEHLKQMSLPAWDDMQEYCALWTLPNAFQKTCSLASLFTSSKVKSYREASKVKLTASEVLCFYPLLQHHVQTIEDNGGASHQTNAFLKLCHVMDLLVSTQFAEVSPMELDQAAESALKAMKLAKWEKHCIKKFHWLLHYGDQLRQHQMLLPCWCMERKHKDVTTVATRIQNLQNFETTVLVEVLSQQLHNMQQWPKEEAALETKTQAPKKLLSFLQHHLGIVTSEVYTCKNLVLKGGGLASGNDIVVLGARREVGQIIVNFGIGREAWSLVSMLTLVSYNAKNGVANWAPTNSVVCVSANEIAHALTFAKTKNGFRTLLPYHLRWKIEQPNHIVTPYLASGESKPPWLICICLFKPHMAFLFKPHMADFNSSFIVAVCNQAFMADALSWNQGSTFWPWRLFILSFALITTWMHIDTWMMNLICKRFKSEHVVPWTT